MGASLYHINLETGEPGLCRATMGKCPFGDVELHFTTEEGARRAYELIAAAEKAKALQAWKKKPRATPKRIAPNPVPTTNSYGGGHGRSSGYYGGGHGGHGR